MFIPSIHCNPAPVCHLKPSGGFFGYPLNIRHAGQLMLNRGINGARNTQDEELA
ncbi:MAG: hypothetical protein VX603_12740 [Gemmatimonadota bacterium]|nr:hypothetical protein [Gemmatimonadota bacterium]